MMRHKSIIPLFMLSAAGLLQSTLLYPISLWGVKPDFVLSMAVAWSLLRGTEEGMLWGFIGGVMLDFLTGTPFGVYILAMVAACFLASVGQMSIFPTNITLPLLAIGAASIAYYLLSLLLLRATGWPVAWREATVGIVLPAMLLNGLCMPLIYGIMQRISAFCRRFGW